MITVAGYSPSLDLTYQVPTLRLGHIQRSSDVVRCAGGKPFNFARAAVTLGSSVTVVALLGGPTGELLEHELARAGAEVVAVATPHETRTCVSIASADTGTLTEVYQNAAEVPAAVWAGFRAALAYALARRPGWLVVNGGAPLGLAGDALADLVRLGREHGARVALDSYGAPLAAAVDAGPAVVKVNRDEAAGLLGAGADADLMEMADELQQRSKALVVLTDGVRGVALADGSRRVLGQLPDVVGGFAVGSGDAFLAGLVSELDRGTDPEQALSTGLAAAVANALVAGPGNLDPAEAHRLRGRVRLSAAGA